ncbi:hypothetical protein PISMIDRAFT_684672 [Pisolithus microcarpus 441]|uniref:Uncharacterized protein n=1 Tax=Pisolithus microcarpus 441 TaxID=765257 RepID=A0A0C9YV72_9AGAM|nr:hypothetical protein BKA83DRAFT_4330177 [Pisolithus microcarpus]KAI6032229.1 hypothetical protein BKA83DRAFT_684672 [Pisolithus microcarpus]KIK17909.1 hypothetical protein PISMIDRAFT_684672 [Pisolithus microcarpus 441]
MPYRHISSGLKDCAICLLDSGWENEDICVALGVLSNSCYRWRRILAEHGSCERPALMPDAVDAQHVEGVHSLGMFLFEASSIPMRSIDDPRLHCHSRCRGRNSMILLQRRWYEVRTA